MAPGARAKGVWLCGPVALRGRLYKKVCQRSNALVSAPKKCTQKKFKVLIKAPPPSLSSLLAAPDTRSAGIAKRSPRLASRPARHPAAPSRPSRAPSPPRARSRRRERKNTKDEERDAARDDRLARRARAPNPRGATRISRDLAPRARLRAARPRGSSPSPRTRRLPPRGTKREVIQLFRRPFLSDEAAATLTRRANALPAIAGALASIATEQCFNVEATVRADAERARPRSQWLLRETFEPDLFADASDASRTRSRASKLALASRFSRRGPPTPSACAPTPASGRSRASDAARGAFQLTLNGRRAGVIRRARRWRSRPSCTTA